MPSWITWLSTNYNKWLIPTLTIVIIIGNQMLGTDLGLTPVAKNWISLIVGSAGSVLTLLTSNKWQPTVPPGHVVVPADQIKPGADVKFQRPLAIMLAFTAASYVVMLKALVA